MYNGDFVRLYLLGTRRSASTAERRHISTAEGNPASHKGHQIIVFSVCVYTHDLLRYSLVPWSCSRFLLTHYVSLSMMDSGAFFQHSEAQLCFLLGQWTSHACYVVSAGFSTTLVFCCKALTTQWFVIVEWLVMAYTQFLFCVFFNCRPIYEHWVLYVNFIFF